MDLDSVVEELYGLDPAEFTARRDALAAEARKGGDRELAGAIKALKKPSAAAYTVNLMARTHAEEIERLIALGGRLREAQEALSGDDLRALGRQRQQLVAGVAQEARRTAREAGHVVSEAVQREVESTFEAALADEAAGEAVRQGRLLRSLERSGMDPVDLDGAVAGTAAGVAPATGRPAAAGRARPDKASPSRPAPAPGEGGDELARARRAREEKAREERARAEEEVARAEEEARVAREHLTAAVSDHESAERRRDEAEEVVSRLQEQLAEARDRADHAAAEEHRARRARRDAEDRADAAGAAADRARRRADALGG